MVLGRWDGRPAHPQSQIPRRANSRTLASLEKEWAAEGRVKGRSVEVYTSLERLPSPPVLVQSPNSLQPLQGAETTGREMGPEKGDDWRPREGSGP